MRRANAEVTDQIFVEVFYPGAFLAESRAFLTESSQKRVRYADPKAFARRMPKGAFGFRYIQKTVVKVLGEGRAVLKEKKLSGIYYVGKKMTLAEVKALKPAKSYEILISNMQCNKWDEVVSCGTGGFQHLEKDDRVIEPKGKRNGKAT